MADYVAVAEAVRLAETKTALLREVMKMRSQSNAEPVAKKAPSGHDKTAESHAKKA